MIGMFLRGFEDVPRNFLECFKEVSKSVSRSPNWVSRVFKRIPMGV